MRDSDEVMASLLGTDERLGHIVELLERLCGCDLPGFDDVAPMPQDPRAIPAVWSADPASGWPGSPERP